ncbi:MAG: hypothetical protein K2X87_09975 [Gemmataceae bacterium]|nr:hypothetical protein [Gemmataceae bacterium]
MATIPPIVRQMILCDDVLPSTRRPGDHDALGLIHSVYPDPPGFYPAVLPVLCVYLQLTGGRGSGVGQVVVVEADTGGPVFAGRPHTIDYPPDPLAVVFRVFRVLDCKFPRSGLYWVQFRHDGRELSAQPLVVR